VRSAPEVVALGDAGAFAPATVVSLFAVSAHAAANASAASAMNGFCMDFLVK
jgi:hypothetical protein